jgi:DNA-binding MarR family transcriptional regulator
MKIGELHWLFAKTSGMYAKAAQAKLSKFEISKGQPRILNFLFEHDGCIQNEIAKNCDLKPASVTSILAGMEKAGLIFRLNDSADRRILRVMMTDKGQQAREQAEKVFYTFEKEIFEDFSDLEKEAMQIFLDRMTFNLKKMNERKG